MIGVYMASSVQDLYNIAETSIPPIDNGTQLIRYFRSAQQILMQANVYKREGDFEKAYIHMTKYSILVLKKLPNHSQYRKPELQKDVSSARQMVGKLLAELEAMKLVLQKQYDDENRAQELQKQKEREEQLAIEREQEQRNQREEAERAAQEAYMLAQQEEQRQREAEERQRVEMELFAQQQLHLQKGMSNVNTGDVLQPLQSRMEHLQLQEFLPPDANPTAPAYTTAADTDAQPVQSHSLPQDFFMLAESGLPVHSNPASPQISQLDFLTPMPSVPSPSPSSPNPSSSNPDPTAPLLDIPSDAFSVRAPVDRFSHLDALAPPSKEQYQTTEVVERTKAPVAYPNLYSTSSSSSNFTYVPAKPPAPQPSPITTLPPHSNVQTQSPTYSHPNGVHSNFMLPPTYNAHAPPSYNIPRAALQQPHPYPQPQLHLHPQPQAQSVFQPQPRSQPHPQFQPQSHSQPQPQPQLQPQLQPQPQSQPQPRPQSQPQSQPQLQSHPQAQPQTLPQRPATNFMPQPVSSNSKQTPNRGRMEESPVGAFGPSKPNVNALRRLVVYGEMFEAFMKVAQSNTQRKVETCAILAGTLSKNTFCITTMIVPKQEGTTDTCSATNEEELFEYQMNNDLLTLGWIHTHPTQDCFMSSVDMHTHCTYQLMLPEAIAVVISPMYTPNFGIFRISDPPGMQIIQKCNLRGFHQHADTYGKTLYSLCDHVDLVWGSKNFKVVDLR